MNVFSFVGVIFVITRWKPRARKRGVPVETFSGATITLETFLVTSWAEHIRQHERFTRGDLAAEARVRALVEEAPVIRHLVHADITP